jgi:hypothetical protein
MAEKKRPLYFTYDPANPIDIHVMFSVSDRDYYPEWNLAQHWIKANVSDIKRMAKAGLFSAFVVHTGSRDLDRPRIALDGDIDQLLDVIRQMGPPMSPRKPKPKLQIPFDDHGNQLRRGGGNYRHAVDHNGKRVTNVVWKDNHTFVATMTFGAFVKGGAAASYIRMTDQQGRHYNMFLRELEKAIHHINNGTLSGKFTFCRIGISFGVKFLESEKSIQQRLGGDGKPKQMSW